MITDAPNLNILWAELIIEELIRNGVDHFIISPGSRSTPLTVAAARNPKAKTTVHFDERGAAYFALGTAKALGKPCALICTSGTAVANYFPAIVEASMSYVPLVVLTADRPPELQNTGANQTINQTNIYGEYVRHFVAMPCPDEQVHLEYVLTTVNHAVAAARRSPSGPVHINCAYREPLAPSGDLALDVSSSIGIEQWLKSDKPYSQWKRPEVTHEVGDVFALAERIHEFERALFIVGNLPDANQDHGDGTAALILQSLFDVPVFADITSGARLQPSLPENNAPITNYDLMLLSPRFREHCTPDVVIHLGGPIVSKRLSEHLADANPTYYIHVADHGSRLDPNHRVTHRVQASTFSAVLDLFPDKKPRPSAWTTRIREASRVAHDAVRACLGPESTLTEPLIASTLGEILPDREDTAIFVGNSMPVRYLDMYSGLLQPFTRIVSNRGSSGIDGNIATAAGYARASGIHTIALIGDLTALHDLNSLSLLTGEGVRVTLIVLNNNGGGIFHFLPIAEHTDVFEKYFGTPHGLHFNDAARMFGLPYSRPTTKAEFVEAYKMAQDSATSCIIEVITDREENLRLHRKISDAVVKALD
ncbi:MAG: 2-succinyl-5-enolpyruvyl-6-hydroxy-3-cyclohexene-1-carboxylic-acid synthase [Candidatus Hydrogenedentes bacterium]|nr:2-succinyl-5-enolpyruvyl-6-hydroxy-3-cyclohexene-1-carboxylic-acid synthase [Candidatus Hydrogenedentota bacterium]